MSKTLSQHITQHLQKEIPSVSGAFFRICFGLAMLGGIIRFWLKGWIEELYIKPQYFFSYWGFEWITPPPAPYIYILFGIIALSALGITLGFKYKWSVALFFLSFSFVELMDKSNYLNHYYFVSLMSFLMFFLPFNTSYSLDATLNPNIKRETLPAWIILLIKIQIGIVYFFGGIAKIKYDWIVEAQPLKIWLASNSSLPVIGEYLTLPWVAYVFAYFGLVFDLTVPFFLSFKQTRIFAYGFVVIFHVVTAWLFYIGMFPYIMMLLVLVFFPSTFHKKILEGVLKIKSNVAGINSKPIYFPKIYGFIIALFFLYQAVMPFRYLLYKGNMLWSEQGFRYSWNIMLIEKVGFVEFIIKDNNTQKQWIVNPDKYLTKNQTKQMAQQADMILQFAHFLVSEYKKQGYNNLSIYADSYASLNGRGSQRYIYDTVDLALCTDGLAPKDWITPLNESIFFGKNK